METSREKLFEEAVALGLNPHHATGVVKLQEMIDAKINGDDTALVNYDQEGSGSEEVGKPIETKAQRISRMRRVQKQLIRVIIRCHSENKKERTGETFTVICAAGTIKRFVPFDNENGWHVEQAILDVIESKLCQKFKNTKLPNGQMHRVSFMVKEFSIERLPTLTQEQLDDLASEQAARGSIDQK